MMFKRPMVISYILSALMRRIMAWQSGQQRPYTQWVGLPYVLANEEIAPEYLQEQATVENLLPAVERALYDQAHRTYVQERRSEERRVGKSENEGCGGEYTRVRKIENRRGDI